MAEAFGANAVVQVELGKTRTNLYGTDMKNFNVRKKRELAFTL